MRVALDGQFLHLPHSGIGTYVRNLIPELRMADPSLDLSVLEPGWSYAQQGALGRLIHGRRARRAWWELFGVGLAARFAKPDLLHLPAFSAPVVPSGRFVVTVHDAIPFMIPAYRASRAMRVNLAIARRTTRKARLVIVPSQAAAADVSTVLGIPRERVRITPEAAGPEYRPPSDRVKARARAAELGVKEGRYIFNVGGLDLRKNVPLLIEAFARLRERLDEPVRLVIAGERHSDNPAVFPPLEPVIRRLGLGDWVVLTGPIAEMDKIVLLQAADLYVTPSYLEGFGLTALEAMACGAPTIAANRSSFPEVVGEGGLLADVDAKALSAVMELVLTNEQVAADLRARGITRAGEFSWRRTAELTLAVYREALEMGPEGDSDD